MSGPDQQPDRQPDRPPDRPPDRQADRPHVYTHGHQPAVLRSHSWRTAENSAAYLLPHLQPGLRMLDLGCGPGTITIDLAKRIAPGEVLGIDASANVVETATQNADAAGCDNVRFATGDAYALEAADATYDVVHAHQVLQHLGDPIAALREARRVIRPGGVLAVRDSDYGAFFWSPPDPRLDRWLQLYHHVTQRNGAQADAGRWLPLWVRQAGFTDIEVTSTSWAFADAESRAWWGGLWAERVRSTALADQAVEYGLSSEAELDDLGDAFEQWAADPDALFVVPHVEVIARAPVGI